MIRSRSRLRGFRPKSGTPFYDPLPSRFPRHKKLTSELYRRLHRAELESTDQVDDARFVHRDVRTERDNQEILARLVPRLCDQAWSKHVEQKIRSSSRDTRILALIRKKFMREERRSPAARQTAYWSGGFVLPFRLRNGTRSLLCNPQGTQRKLFESVVGTGFEPA